MTPGARIRTAIELLDRIERPPPGRDDVPADVVVSAYFRGHRFAGAKDRRAISDAVFAVLRRRAQLDWRWRGAGDGTNRHRVLAHLVLTEGRDLPALEKECDGGRYGVAPLSEVERHSLRSLADGTPEHAPLAVRGNFPAWLEDEVRQGFGCDAEPEFAAINEPAPLDLRVNTLKAERAAILPALAGRGLPAVATPYSPQGVRIARRLTLPALAEYRDGLVELQDEASQLAALLVEALPGMRVLDYCAGAGGKSLALAAQMANRGTIFAHDTAPDRLRPLAMRAARAGATIIRATHPVELAAAVCAGFDRVLVDAPCSGSGTWRRHPDAKWRLTPERLAAFRVAQRQCLDRAAAFVRPGGRLAYATCSLLPSENQRQIADFLGRNAAFRLVPLPAIWRRLAGEPPPFVATTVQLTPHRSSTDGFFVAILERHA